MHGSIEYRSRIVQAAAVARLAVATGPAARLRLRRVRVEGRGEREEGSYRRYCTEQRQAYREFSQLRPEEQRAYWHWRDTHDREL